MKSNLLIIQVTDASELMDQNGKFYLILHTSELSRLAKDTSTQWK